MRLRAVVLGALVMTLVFGQLGAFATASEKRRTVTASYSGAGGYSMGANQGTVQLGANWTTFKARGAEKWVSLTVRDLTGEPVLAHVYFQFEGPAAVFCGSTAKPIRIPPSGTISVGAMGGTCENGDVSAPTSGTVEATFSRSR